MKQKIKWAFVLLSVMLSTNLWGANHSGTFTKITDASDFTTGYYVITGMNVSKALGSSANSDKRIAGVSITISNGSITNPSTTVVYYITVNNTTCTFQNESTGNYMYQSGTTSGKGMAFQQSSSNITFEGWVSGGSGKSAYSGWAFTLNGNSNNKLKWNNSSSWFANYANDYSNSMTPVDLYKLASEKTNVKYDANGKSLKSGSTLPADEKVDAGKDYNVSTATVAADGCKFIGWNTDMNATNGITKVPAATMVKDATVTLYAIWKSVYSITPSVTGSGTIKFSTNGTNWSNTIADQEANADVYFKLVPNAGYEVSGTPTVSNVAAGNITENNGVYKFAMPAASVTVSATFSCATPTFKTNLSTETVVYTQNHDATALSVAANETWNINYQWQSSTDNTNWSNIGTNSANYTPSTETAGTTYYRCLLKNGVGTCETYATSSVATIQVDAPSVCEDPEIGLASGDYTGAQSATIICMREGATIYYTTDGTDPSVSSTEYTGPVTIDRDMTLKAIAVKSGLTNSGIVSATYTIKYNVTFNMKGHGTQVDGQQIGYEEFVSEPSTTSITGWTFGGWFKEDACTNQWNFASDKITGHTTLYAKWTMTKFDVKFYNNGNLVQTYNIQEGQAVGTLPVLTSTDAKDARSKTFVGWTESEINVWQANAPTPITASEVINGVKTYNAVWAKETEGTGYTNNYQRITTTADLTSGDYIFVAYERYYSTDYYWALDKTTDNQYYLTATNVTSKLSNDLEKLSNITDNDIVWTIAFKNNDNSKISIKNGSSYLNIISSSGHHNLKCSSTSDYFTYSVNNGLWKFVSENQSGYKVYYDAGHTNYTATSKDAGVEGQLYLYKRIRDIAYTDYITHSSSSPLASITLNTDNVKKNYFVGETFTSAGLTATATLGDGITFPIEYETLNISTPDLSTVGEKTVTVEYTFNGATKSNTFTVNVYSVTINSVYTDRVNDESVDGNTYTWNAQTHALTFTKQAHYKFNGIDNVVGADATGSDLSYTLSNPTANVTLTAEWQRLFTLTYNGKGGSTPTAVTDKTKGTEITLATPSWTGYEFVGWYDNESYEGDALTSLYSITADAEIFAKWSEIMPASISLSPDVTEITDLIYDDSNKKTKTITATVNPSTALTKTFTWSVVEGADVVSVSSEGLITALKAGSAKVKVASTRVPTIYKEISVTVHSLPQITWLNMDGSTYASTNGTSAGKVGTMPSGTPSSCDDTTYPYFRGWSATNFGKTTDNPEANFVNVNTLVELDEEYTFYAVYAAGTSSISTVFTETFDKCAGTGGNDGSWSGNIATNNINADNTGWTFSNGRGGSKCAKFAASSKAGSAKTPSITMNGNGTIYLRAGSFGTDGTTLSLSATSGTVGQTSISLTNGEFKDYEISISNVTNSTQITFSSSSGKRFFIDNVVVKAGSISYTTWATQCCTTPKEPLEITNTNLTVKTNGTLELQTTEGIKNVTKVWASLNGAVATVANGIVTPVSTGKATITVSQDATNGFCAQYDEVEIEVIAANEFGISFTAAEGGSTVAKVNDTPTNKATTGTTVTIIATPDDDYNFKGWTVNAGGVTLADASLATTTFVMGEADVEITPSFTLKKFTVTLDAGTGDVETTSYTEDVRTIVTLPAAAHCQPDVWAFQGWSETNVEEVTSDCPALVDNNYEITKDVTLYAIYKKADGGEKTIGYKISYQANNTTYYASSGVSQQKMSVSTDADDAIVFGITTTSGQSKLYRVDANGTLISGSYIYLDSDKKLTEGNDYDNDKHKWTISMTGTHSIVNVGETDRCIAGRSGSSGLNVVNASTANVDAGPIVNGSVTNYFHHITLVPVVKGAASYCTSPECVSLTWVNGMLDADPVVTYPANGKIVLPTQTPTSCAPGLYSFVGWTTTEIPNYKTSQQEVVTAEMAAPEHATTYYAEFVSTAGNRYRTSCPETLYAITYKANGGEGEDYIQYSENMTNVTSYDGAAFSKTDCSLYQWNTAANGTGTAYKPNANISSLTGIVGEGTTGTLYAQWTGELNVSGNVHLTSGKDIAVYTTAPAGNLITISCPAIDMVHHIRYKFLDSENNQVSTLKLCNNGTDNFNQLTNIATDGVVGAYEQTFSICYTPTEYNQKATYTLLLEGVNQGGTTVFNSCTLSVTVRSLPEQFVIAIKKTTGDNQGWYAVPNVLETTALAAPDALTIEVDDNNNPTYAWLSDNTTAALYMSASRYEANKHRGAIRFQSVENDKYITASYAKDATSFYMPNNNADAQQFYLTSTDCNVYKVTLDPAEYVGKDYEPRCISFYGNKIGWYNTSACDVYFLPIKTITEEIKVNDGETVNLSEYEVDENTTIIVHAGGTLNADKVATIGTLQIERAGGKSGQVNETATLTANNAYFDVTLNAQGMKWYDIAVPFTVDRLHGLSFPNGGNFPLNDVLVYNGATRATNGANGSAWQYQDDGDLKPGVGYDIMFATYVQTVRFTKKADAQLNNENEELAVSEFVYSNPLDANWNYVANNTLHYVNLGFDDSQNSGVIAQTYNPEDDNYTAYTQAEATYLVGTPFFVQVAAEDFVVWGTTPIHDILRAPAMTTNRVDRFTLEMSANGEMTDRLFVSADENARDEYQIGKDVAKMGVSSTIAQMWVDNYNTKLCANEAILYNGMATYQMGIFIPKEGEYTIAITNAPENATLYLTMDGLPIWNLSESAYVSTFTKGTHTEFGLLLQANTQSTPTNINSLNGNNKAQKIFKDQNIYILRDAKLYNAQGTELK